MNILDAHEGSRSNVSDWQIISDTGVNVKMKKPSD
jgi:hypothetical protein